MSANTPSFAREFAALALAAGLVACGPCLAAANDAMKAPSLPPKVAEALPQMGMVGRGEFTFFGLSVYDGVYWSAKPGYSPDQPFALELRYRRTLKGDAIAERSVDEIAKMGAGTPEQRSRWTSALKRIFPNVADGDRLIGVNVPGVGARFFHNGAPIGEIAEPAFAQAFFGIWLDPKTSRPDFRKQLLGE
jgi:hypothetical protein